MAPILSRNTETITLYLDFGCGTRDALIILIGSWTFRP